MSPLKSARATERGCVPTARLVAAPKLPVPSPNRIDTLPESLIDPLLATARSSLLSLLKSPTAIETGVSPAEKLAAVPKPPAPSPMRIETFVEPEFATARSGLLSALKSPSATACGFVPTEILAAGAKLGVPPLACEILIANQAAKPTAAMVAIK